MDFDPREFLVDHFMNERVEDQLYDITFGSEEWLQMDAGLLTREEGDRIMREKGAALRRSFEVGVILDDWYDMLRTKDDTVQLIKRLKKRGYGVFYLSNISWDVLEMLQQRKFWQLFDGGVASCEVKLTKPDLRIYHALLAKYGLSAAESIFIDDNTANASAAFDADITGIHFKNVRTLQRALLSYGVESEKKLSRQKQAATAAAEYALPTQTVKTRPEHFVQRQLLAEKAQRFFAKPPTNSLRPVRMRTRAGYLNEKGVHHPFQAFSRTFLLPSGFFFNS